MGRLHLPQRKVEALASCTPKDNAHLHDLVYQMYLNGMSAVGDVPVHASSEKKNVAKTYLWNVKWWETQNWSRVKLLEDFSVWLPGLEKGWGIGCRGFYTGKTQLITYADAYAIYQKFLHDTFDITTQQRQFAVVN